MIENNQNIEKSKEDLVFKLLNDKLKSDIDEKQPNLNNANEFLNSLSPEEASLLASQLFENQTISDGGSNPENSSKKLIPQPG